jgi:hypothetical protein
MIEKSTYRLGEYQIAEYDDGALRWTAHHGFGEQWSGKCLILEDILVLEEFIHEEIGYLKGEFLDRIRKLPGWNKTEFYCFASDLLDVSSGRSPGRDLKDYLPYARGARRNHLQAQKDELPSTFRLDKYKITVADNDQISWQTLEGGNRVVGGQCTIQSGILLIGPKNYEAGGQSRGEFLKELNELRPWQRTMVWSHSLALRPCESTPQTERLNDVGKKAESSDHEYHERPILSSLWKEKQESFRPPRIKPKTPSSLRVHLPSIFKFRKPSWHLQGGRKGRWIFLIPLSLAALLLGLVLILHPLKEGSHRHHSTGEHHHK